MKAAEVKGHDFTKKYKVSVWASQHPYAEIPESYFEETFSHKNTRARNEWSKNYNLQFFRPEEMETNGAEQGLRDIKSAAGECSYSSSFIEVLMSKARKKKMEQISWIILLYEYEYSVKISGVEKDKYTTFLGAFDYDDAADSLYEVAE